jgi:hypothetical protein
MTTVFRWLKDKLQRVKPEKRQKNAVNTYIHVVGQVQTNVECQRRVTEGTNDRFKIGALRA